MYHWRTTMHKHWAVLLLAAGGVLGASTALGQACTGLACQQQACSGNQTTSVSGVVYAPNGVDPLPNVTVYVPNATVDPLPVGVTCTVVGTPPSGTPLVGAVTGADGSFTIPDMPVGANIPLVIISGKWRRQLVIPSVSACTNTALPGSFAVMPQNQSQGDIPKIAIATGAVDQVECVLRKMGISDSEFTDPSGSGRINLYGGSAAGSGAVVGSATRTQAALMGDQATLNSYDVVMLPCEGAAYTKPAQELANLLNFANAGGRVYASHFGYTWMYQNPPFNGVANWSPKLASLTTGTATVDISFTAGQTLQTWLQEVGATTTPGQMALNTLRVDTNGVVAPTQSWLALNDSGLNNPTMQFVFDTPIAAPGSGVNQCGRVLFNEYHVEDGVSSPGNAFPSECSSGAMTAQEKLLEYMLFELTDEGGQPTMAPTSADFGSEAIGFTTPTQVFTWKNNSSFGTQVTTAIPSGDFSVVSNNCLAVAAGASCQIGVAFTPTALGARTGTLTVGSSGNTLTATLTGTGTPGYSMTPTTFSFGSLDVGASSTQTFTLSNIASGALPVPSFVTTGPYAVDTSACGSSIAAGGNCSVKITFAPTVTGALNGTLAPSSASLLYNGLGATMTGTGIDFTLTLSPTSGSVIAGDVISSTATLSPLAGFAAQVSVTCLFSSGSSATGCNLSTATAVPPAQIKIGFNTTSQYTVVGYGVGGERWLWLICVGSGCLLWIGRRRTRTLWGAGVLTIGLVAVCLSLTSCTGKLPAQNPAFTAPGTYTVNVTATDGFLVHSSSFTLTVTAK